METRDRISTHERAEWGDSPRECVLSLKLVGKKLGVKFGFFFLSGGDLPEVVCNWAGGPPVSAVYEAVADGVMTDLPVLLRRHASDGELKALEGGDGAVECAYALNQDKAGEPERTCQELASPLGGISSIAAPPPKREEPEQPKDFEEGELSKEEFVRGFANFLHHLIGDRDSDLDANPMVEQVYKVFPEDMMDLVCRRAAQALSSSHKYRFPRLKVGMAVVPSGVTGLPDELMESLWEGGASPVLLISWAEGPSIEEVETTCRARVDTAGVPLLLYQYSKGEPLEVDPLSILRSGRAQGRHKVVRGAVN